MNFLQFVKCLLEQYFYDAIEDPLYHGMPLQPFSFNHFWLLASIYMHQFTHETPLADPFKNLYSYSI